MMSACPSTSEFSTADGFAEIAESLADMIKFVANEPSVGLFYIQQHARNAVPNLVDLKTKVAEETRETALHTEDLEDSIVVARSMKECGFPIVEEMVKDIGRSLALVSTRQDKKGLINIRGSSFRIGRTSSRGRGAGPELDVEKRGYFSNVFRSAREKASGIKWPQLESSELKPVKGEETDSDDLPLSSRMADEGQETRDERRLSRDQEILSLSKSYEELTSEERLENWLEGKGNGNATS